MLQQIHAIVRRVGVISHLGTVTKRVPVKIAFISISGGPSTVGLLAD